MDNILDIYITENQYEASWLYANDIKLLDTVVKSNGFVIFEFESKEKCMNLISEYYSNKKISKIPVRKFVDAIREIKSIMHKLGKNEKNN